MATHVKMAFEPQVVTLSLARILPTKPLRRETAKTAKYRRITASILEVGIIEPLIVYPQRGASADEASYILLDGHVRFQVLQSLGETETACLVATDDESHTYNHHVNRLSPIQETFMILKALENGVEEERIAKALDLDVKKIREKRDLLNGVCPEAVALVKERPISPAAIRYFKRVRPLRQIEMAELMSATNNFTEPYARALYLATSQNMLLRPQEPKKAEGVSPEDLTRMERELESLERDFKLAEDSHGRNVLNLVLARGYLAKLLGNARVVRYLSQTTPDILAEFQRIVEATSLQV